jgi:opacity protein-like surface antigen
MGYWPGEQLMKMRTEIAATIALTCMPLTSTFGEESTMDTDLMLPTVKGWYAGGGLTSSRIHSVAPYGTYIDDSNKDTGYIINVGYRINPVWALELGYLDGGEQNFSSPLGEADISVQVIEASTLLIWPIGIFELYGRFGAGFWKADSQQRWLPADGNPGFTASVSDNDTGFIIGFGMGANIGDHWHLRAEVQDLAVSSSLLAADENLDASFESWMVELHYRFGDNWL